MSGDTPLMPVRNEAELDTAVARGSVVLYKHSDRCFTCHRALSEMEQFAQVQHEVPVYIIDVIRERPLSSRIAERLDIRHESPQAILLQGGRPIWHASHYAVTAEALCAEVDRLREGD